MRTTSSKRTPLNRASGRMLRSPSTFFSILALVVLILVVFLWRDGVASVFWRGAVPVRDARGGLSSDVGGVFAQFSSKAELAAENARLSDALASTSAALLDRDLLYQENLDLKLRLGRDASVPTILAGVVMRPPAVPYDTLTIDAGQGEGVSRGDLVSAGGTTLIGSVDTVYAHASRVVLFSAPGQSYDALLSMTDQAGVATTIPVHVEGQGAGSFTAQVPSGTVVAAGNTILFSGIATGFVGFVSHVEANEGDSFETLYARLPVDPLGLRFVEVRRNAHGQ